MKIIRAMLRIKSALLYPLAYIIIASKSAINGIKYLVKKQVVHFQKTYTGEKILLMALYEKGRLRPDILNLLETAKTSGLYVIAVNTSKVLQPESLQDCIDCYIERPNFGRDFGSYQTGFMYLFKQGWETQCPRLLMLNDSLFFSKKNLAAFLEKMTNNDIEVLGATENYEEDYHLGSFCVSVCQSILKKQLFRKYWSTYKKSDIRPKVIMRGEKALSKTLIKCASDEFQVRALFDVTWLSDILRKNPELIDKALLLCRDSLHPWPQPTIKKIAEQVFDKYFLADYKPKLENNLFVFRSLENIVQFVQKDYNKGKEFLKVHGQKSINTLDIKVQVEKIARSNILSAFKVGSQIHQNAILLHSLGLPIVKLDAIYRGVLSVSDIEEITIQLSDEEKSGFQYLMNKKSFGGGEKVLVGWKKAAFNQGLI